MDKKIIIKIPDTLAQFLKSHPRFKDYNPMRNNTWVGFPTGFSEAWLKYLNNKNEMTKKKRDKGTC
jgi:hypothetical protein